MKFHPFLAVVAACLAAAPVQAGDDCDVPLSQWQSRDAVMRRAAQQGWQVQRLKIDDGCYEIRAAMPRAASSRPSSTRRRSSR